MLWIFLSLLLFLRASAENEPSNEKTVKSMEKMFPDSPDSRCECHLELSKTADETFCLTWMLEVLAYSECAAKMRRLDNDDLVATPSGRQIDYMKKLEDPVTTTVTDNEPNTCPSVSSQLQSYFSSHSSPTDLNDVVERSIGKQELEKIFGTDIFAVSFDTLEGLFTDVQEAVSEPIARARQMLSSSLLYPKSMEDALKCYFANWHPYLSHISREDRTNETIALGWGVKVREDVPKGVYLCGYEGVRYEKIEEIDENVRKRLSTVNNCEDGDYLIQVRDTTSFIEGAVAAAIQHGEHIQLADTKTRLFFYGPFINGASLSRNANVAFLVIRYDDKLLVLVETIRDVKKDEELFADYGSQYEKQF